MKKILSLNLFTSKSESLFSTNLNRVSLQCQVGHDK